MTKTAFTRCRHILKTVKNVMDMPPIHTKKALFCRQILKTVDFENGTLTRYDAVHTMPVHFENAVTAVVLPLLDVLFEVL